MDGLEPDEVGLLLGLGLDQVDLPEDLGVDVVVVSSQEVVVVLEGLPLLLGLDEGQEFARVLANALQAGALGLRGTRGVVPGL